MDERYTKAVGALIIAAALFIGGVFFEKLRHPTVRDVNPIGFHAQGQVQINGDNTLNIHTCSQNNSCTLAFDFSTDENGAQLAPLTCDGYKRCIAFSGDQVSVSDDPSVGGTIQKVNGRVVQVSKKDHHKGDGGLGFHAKGVVQIDSNSLNLDGCSQGAKCTLTFDFWTDANGNEPAPLNCASSQPHCLSFESLTVAVADGPAGIRHEDGITGRVVLDSQP
jgi:hypothetical protein